MDVPTEHRIVKSACGLCQAGCGILVHKGQNNKIVHVEGDPDSPVNRGVLCQKGLSSVEYLYHPDRLKHPLKRIGEKGGGKWQPISWDEALDLLAETFSTVKAAHGPESLVFMRGAFKGGYDGPYLARFANVFGAPNIASMASVCYVPRVYGSVLTHGYHPVPDYSYPPACIVVWGANMAETRVGEYQCTLEAIREGAKLIVIDPRKTGLAARADLWLQPRPGSDLALALGMINVIINENVYDETFVMRWTEGFEELRNHIQCYGPDVIEKTTWVRADHIKEAAMLYASNTPGIIQLGNAIDQNLNNIQTARAVSILRAITGNLGLPGGELACSSTGILSPLGSPEFDMRDKLSQEAREKRLNAKDNLLPNVFYALPQTIMRAILYGEPYRIHAGYIQGGNLMLTYSNARRTYEALRKLDFLAVADMFMTPTAALADVVLPVAGHLEFDSIVAPPYYPVAQVQQKLEQIDDCRSDYEILKDLADRLGLGEYFWDQEEGALDFILKPVGLTFNELRKIGVLRGKKDYRKHEREAFSTPSGKVELYSTRLKEWGFDPLPTYREPPETPYSVPELSEDYPLVFTSWKTEGFRHSGGRQIAPLRNLQPDPLVWIHPDTAGKYGIEEGEWVFIETKRGKIRQRARLSMDIDPRVVGVDYGWWFPEEGPGNLYGWTRSNINILTDDNPPYGKEMGTPNLRGIACRVSRE